MCTIQIKIPSNFSFKEAVSFLDRGFDDCLYNLDDNLVSRLIKFKDDLGLIRISELENSLNVEIIKDQIDDSDIKYAEEFVMEWFDLERDIQPFYDLLTAHPLLSEFPAKYNGSRLIGIPDLFEALSWAIIGQQINLTFAYRIKRNLVETLGKSQIVDGITFYTFPSPEDILSTDRSVFVDLKFSRQKIDYILNVSQAFVDQKISKDILLNLQNKEARMEKLTSIKGIGIWTANYVLMKCIRDESCITYNDSGLNRALVNIFKTEKKPSKETVDHIFKDFPRWESYLNFYLWKSI